MLRALRTAALGMNAQQTGVDTIAHNLANANTTGFKQARVVFQDLLYQTIQTPGQEEAQGITPPASIQLGSGVAIVATVRQFTQGSLIETGNALDLAINGDGFFQIRRPDGSIVYTRDGTFTLNANGTLVTQTGLPLEPELNVPPDTIEIHISQDGAVSVRLQGATESVEIGQLELARFPNPAGLRAIGGNLYEQTEASGFPILGPPGEAGFGTVRQGFLEAANVDIVQEMVNLITAQRAYEINSKMVTTSEEMLQTASQMKR
ncbi:flagellar basal-body rod protein FlgG [Rhodothermus bifroesti]|uniref:Flagellar basal-body rod protein FlgG n=1 Tax=Rhodothermus marinus TaxID=29549 RepID=A0A7V2F5A5_RHOMR|nr:flagellar basal-body rod protein FlgG [Rhodothermus bifroesti]GBD00751.1 Flagellar basal-body rod protein FlgG [bacterium HR18]